MSDDYTAANIHIARDAEILDRWDWARVGHWVRLYCVPEEWLARALEACRRAGVEPEYLERRYLKREGYEPFRPEVDAAMRQIRDEEFRKPVPGMGEARSLGARAGGKTGQGVSLSNVSLCARPGAADQQ